MDASEDYMKCLKGFVHYGRAAEDRQPYKPLGEISKLRGVVRFDDRHQPIFEVLVDITGKKRWAKSVNGGPFVADGKSKRHRRFNGVKAANAGELMILNKKPNFSEILDTESANAVKQLDYGKSPMVVF
jgi:hypothetical protein